MMAANQDAKTSNSIQRSVGALFYEGYFQRLTRSTAKKYSSFDKLRKSLAQATKKAPSSPSRKRSSSAAQGQTLVETPSKRHKHIHSSHPANIDPYDPPISLLLSPSQQRTSIGPTPQKDGQVLGLFDLLSSGSANKTSSKRDALLSIPANLQATPSKRTSSRDGKPDQVQLSASKQRAFTTLSTPTSRRISKSGTPGSRSSVSKLRFDDTPAFLRRDSQRFYTEKENVNGDDHVASWSPIAIRKVPRPAGRGLSALVKGLRDMEDENLDDELEMLREMEGMDSQPLRREQMSQPKLLVPESQIPEMPLGPDGGVESDDSDAYEGEGKGRDGKPLKVWKKKGQKRTTRRVAMKPNVAKWKPEPKWKGGEEVDDEEEPGVVETQVADGGHEAPHRGEGDEDYHDDQNACSGEDSEARRRRMVMDESRKGEEKTEGVVQRAKKKISATAHANFRALKIKNKQSKGKGGGRFGRRR